MARTIVTGGFWHESNTFNPLQTCSGNFTWRAGSEINEWIERDLPDSELRGMIEELEAIGDSTVALLAVDGPVDGAVAHEVFVSYMERLTEALSCLDPETIDGVVWGLHGSATVHGVEDAQAQIMALLRRVFGPDKPIYISVDLHASISARLQNEVDGICAFLTAPHRDTVETGRRAARLLKYRLGQAQIPTGLVMVSLPMLLPGEYGQTDTAPTSEVMKLLREYRDRADVLESGFLQGYPWADNENATISLVAVTDGPPSLSAIAELERIGFRVWGMRDQFYRSVPVLSPEQALAKVRQRLQDRLLYLCDSGDNPTAGALEDRVDLLALALKEDVRGLLFAPLVAPVAVQACAGCEGSDIELMIGSQLAAGTSLELKTWTKVLSICEDAQAGTVAIVETGGNRIILTSRRISMTKPDWLEGLGLDPRSSDFVWVLKSGYLFPAFVDLVAHTFGAESWLVATPGASSLDLNTFDYQTLPHRPYPLSVPEDHAYKMVTRSSIGRKIEFATRQLDS